MLDSPFAEIFRRIAAEHGERDCVVTPLERVTYAEAHETVERIASFLEARGFGAHRERRDLEGHASGQDHLGILAGNGRAYLETMFAAMRARLAPVNLNYRYTAPELRQVLRVAEVNVIAYEADLAEVVGDAIAGGEPPALMIELGGGRTARLPGAVSMATVLEAGGPPASCVPQADDLVVSCTGGTTGLPKAVLWRQGDLLAGVIGNPHTITNQPVRSLEDLLASARRPQVRALLGPPLMHFSGFGTAMMLASMGGAIILADPPRGMNPQSIWSMVERERARFLTVVGDAFGRPLLETFRSCRYDASSLRAILNGGAAMSPDVKRGLHEAFDGKVAITDGVGSTEGGIQARTRWTGSEQPATFAAAAQTRLLNAAKTAVLQPGDGEIGWLATAGRVPLGYLGEQQRTRETFPVIDGARCAVPGDRARWIDAERIELLGRDSTTINSGGEKIFSEEVERALLRHCSVREAIVVGRPSLRWGEEAIALVALHPGFALDQAAILASAGEALARYKLPKAILRVDEVRKTAVGKPDLVWARGLAAQGGPHAHDRP